MKSAPALALLLSLVGVSGCSSEQCALDSDCFAGESCIAERCAVVQNSDTTNNTASNNGMTAQNNAQNDNGDVGVDAPDDGRPADVGNMADDMGSAVADMSSQPDSGESGCTIDPFTDVCTDDAFEDNDTWIDGHYLSASPLGCNPDFEAFDDTFLATMCALDGSDWYYVNFVPCAGTSYILEWQLELTSDCDPSVIAFEPLSYKCDESFVECSTVDGKPTIRMIVNQQNFQNLSTTYVQVHNNDRDDTKFDYRIRVSTR